MSEDRLVALLALDDPPARDRAFTLAVLERAATAGARRKLAGRIAVWTALGVAAIVGAPAMAPWLAETGQGLETALLVGAALLAALGLSRGIEGALAGP